jgi:hypothetical protein
VAGCYCGCK